MTIIPYQVKPNLFPSFNVRGQDLNPPSRQGCEARLPEFPLDFVRGYLPLLENNE